jgi:hypothetical protein
MPNTSGYHQRQHASTTPRGDGSSEPNTRDLTGSASPAARRKVTAMVIRARPDLGCRCGSRVGVGEIGFAGGELARSGKHGIEGPSAAQAGVRAAAGVRGGSAAAECGVAGLPGLAVCAACASTDGLCNAFRTALTVAVGRRQDGDDSPGCRASDQDAGHPGVAGVAADAGGGEADAAPSRDQGAERRVGSRRWRATVGVNPARAQACRVPPGDNSHHAMPASVLGRCLVEAGGLR